MKLNSPPSGGGGGDALPAADVSPPGETQSGRWRTTSGSTCRQLRFCFCSFSSGMLVKKSGMSSGADRTFSSSVDSLLTPPPTPPPPCFRSLVSHLRDAKQDEGKKKNHFIRVKFAEAELPQGFNTPRSNCEDPWNDFSSGLQFIRTLVSRNSLEATFKRSRMMQNEFDREQKTHNVSKKSSVCSRRCLKGGSKQRAKYAVFRTC